MNNEEDPNQDTPTLTINFNIFKFNLVAAIIGVTLSYFKANSEYIKAVYDSIILLTIYTNVVVIYLLYVNRHKL